MKGGYSFFMLPNDVEEIFFELDAKLLSKMTVSSYMACPTIPNKLKCSLVQCASGIPFTTTPVTESFLVEISLFYLLSSSAKNV